MQATGKKGTINPHIFIYILALILTMAVIFGGSFLLRYFLSRDGIARRNAHTLTTQISSDISQPASGDERKAETLSDDTTSQIASADVTKIGDADFRDVKWGMTPDEVKKREAIQFNTEIDGRRTVLGGEARIDGKNCLLIYTFIDNKLMRALCSFTETHTGRDGYHRDYQSVDEMLKGIYGKPVGENTAQPGNAGQNTGNVGIKTKWNAKNGNYVIHNLYGDKQKTSHWVEYTTYANKTVMDAFDKENAK
jgi:hypothetical protein